MLSEFFPESVCNPDTIGIHISIIENICTTGQNMPDATPVLSTNETHRHGPWKIHDPGQWKHSSKVLSIDVHFRELPRSASMPKASLRPSYTRSI